MDPYPIVNPFICILIKFKEFIVIKTAIIVSEEIVIPINTKASLVKTEANPWLVLVDEFA